MFKKFKSVNMCKSYKFPNVSTPLGGQICSTVALNMTNLYTLVSHLLKANKVFHDYFKFHQIWSSGSKVTGLLSFNR